MIRAYWWSPKRSATALAAELRSHCAGWLRLALQSRRLPANFGDELTPLVLEIATGQPVSWAPAHKAEVLAVGSVIERYVDHGGQGLVWGSGLRTGGTGGAESARLKFLAVRGHATREALGLPAMIPLGDPGLILREYGMHKPRRKSGTILIPHFRTFMSEYGRSLLRRAQVAGVSIVPPITRPLDVLNAIRRSDHVLTSSLHGLVLADACGIPAQRVDTLPNAHREPEFKFADYESALGVRSDTTPLDKCLEALHLHNQAADARPAAIGARVDQTIERLAKAAADI